MALVKTPPRPENPRFPNQSDLKKPLGWELKCLRDQQPGPVTPDFFFSWTQNKRLRYAPHSFFFLSFFLKIITTSTGADYPAHTTLNWCVISRPKPRNKFPASRNNFQNDNEDATDCYLQTKNNIWLFKCVFSIAQYRELLLFVEPFVQVKTICPANPAALFPLLPGG